MKIRTIEDLLTKFNRETYSRLFKRRTPNQKHHDMVGYDEYCRVHNMHALAIRKSIRRIAASSPISILHNQNIQYELRVIFRSLQVLSNITPWPNYVVGINTLMGSIQEYAEAHYFDL